MGRPTRKQSPVLFDPSAERLLVDLHDWRIEGAVLLGRYSYATPHAPLEAHHHGGLIEICYLDRGHQAYEMAGQRYELQGGEVLVVPPGKEHGTGGAPEDRGVMYWLILQPPVGHRRFLGLPAPDGRQLLRRLTDMSRPKFRGRVALRESLEAVFRAAASAPAALSRAEIRNRLVRFLLDLIDCADQAPSAGPSPPLQAVLEAMDRTLDRNLPLDDYARLAGLSLSRFKVRFKQEVGTSPAPVAGRARREGHHRGDATRLLQQPILRDGVQALHGSMSERGAPGGSAAMSASSPFPAATRSRSPALPRRRGGRPRSPAGPRPCPPARRS